MRGGMRYIYDLKRLAGKSFTYRGPRPTGRSNMLLDATPARDVMVNLGVLNVFGSWSRARLSVFAKS
jgi:hypothetical protein